MDTKLRDHKVQEGMLVQVELIQRSGETEWMEFTLVKDELADFRAGFLGLGTPLAKKILGKYEDAIVDYTEGDLSSVRILSIEPSDKTPTEDVNSRRNELMCKVRNQAEHINAVMFSSSVNGKWGDYDIDSINPDQWEED
ncbi:MAG: hypothetical protein ACK2TS_03685 [Anaerolineales bacterium]